jgi:hypothetical protein
MRSSKLRLLNKLLLLATVLVAIPAAAQTARPPEQVAKEFYTWYFHEMNAEREPRNQRAKITASVSKRLSNWYFSRKYSDYGADYFIDAQDYEQKWETTLTTTKATISGNSATLKVNLPAVKGSGFGAKTLSLRMVKESNAWKIDRVNNRAFPG